ncbi:MAG: hypothetical protein NTX65_12085 [Ignavibacteriales bacterium]|nr:hypothetical protein [Ignavibacteriales bacterium]
MLMYLLIIYIYTIISFFIGFPLARYFWSDRKVSVEDGILRYKIILASPLLGFLVFNLIVFTLSGLLKSGVDKLALPVMLILVLLVIAFYVKNMNEIQLFFSIIKSNMLLLIIIGVIVIPIAIFHIVFPMIKYSWLMSYSIGNDGSRYLMMVDYLQKQRFMYGVTLNQTLFYPMANRPLMHYAMAIPVSLFHTNGFISYSAVSSMFSIFSSLSLGLLISSLFNNKGVIRTVILSSIVFGTFGFFLRLYYEGFVGQYYAAFPFLFMLSIISIDKKTSKHFVFLLFGFIVNSAMYSTGNTVLLVLFMIALIIPEYIIRDKSYKHAAIFVLILALTCLISLFIFSYELHKYNPSDFVSQRNAGYDYGLTLSLLNLSGLLSKHFQIADVGTLTTYIYAFFIIFFSTSVYLMLKEKKKVISFASLFIISIITIILLYRTYNYYFLNKVSTLLMPLFFLSPIYFLSTINFKKFSIIKAILPFVSLLIIGLFVYSGYKNLRLFAEIADQRKTNVDSEMIKMKDHLLINNPFERKIFVIDYGLERHLLLRQFFKEFQWQPIKDESLWAEFMYKRDSYPKEFDDYENNILLVGNDLTDPVDYSADKDYLIYSNNYFSIYNKTASYFDFDLSWKYQFLERIQKGSSHVDKYSKTTKDTTSIITFVNNGEFGKLQVEFECKNPLNLSTEPLFSVMIGNKSVTKENLKVLSADNYLLSFTRKNDFPKRVTTITFNQKAGSQILIRNILFDRE